MSKYGYGCTLPSPPLTCQNMELMDSSSRSSCSPSPSLSDVEGLSVLVQAATITPANPSACHSKAGKKSKKRDPDYKKRDPRPDYHREQDAAILHFRDTLGMQWAPVVDHYNSLYYTVQDVRTQWHTRSISGLQSRYYRLHDVAKEDRAKFRRPEPGTGLASTMEIYWWSIASSPEEYLAQTVSRNDKDLLVRKARKKALRFQGRRSRQGTHLTPEPNDMEIDANDDDGDVIILTDENGEIAKGSWTGHMVEASSARPTGRGEKIRTVVVLKHVHHHHHHKGGEVTETTEVELVSPPQVVQNHDGSRCRNAMDIKSLMN